MSFNPFAKEEPNLRIFDKIKMFFAAHWRGVVALVVPLVLLALVYPDPTLSKWTLYTLLVMAIFWVTEVIPLAVTGFLPVLVFPCTGVESTLNTCRNYMNDAVMMFLCSLILAASIEQSGLHKRLAYFVIRVIGYSHMKLLGAMCIVTTFISMWITNTAATSMMVPILFAMLKVFEGDGSMSIYEYNKQGNKVASDITACYFCAATYSATIGGIGTLVGTATNLAFKSLFQSQFDQAPDYLSFPKFSAFAVPYMIALEICCYLYLAILYLGLFRPNSKAAKKTQLSARAKRYAKSTIADERKKIGKITFWEILVCILFIIAILSFFLRSPQMFTGWANLLRTSYSENDEKFIKDSASAMLVIFFMFLLPSTYEIIKNCRAKTQEGLPKNPIPSLLDWKKLNIDMPYSFMFLLGGGVALAKGAKSSGLNDKIGETFSALSSLPNDLIIFLVILIIMIITNFASNVAVINVFGPITMALATKMKVTQLWYIIASGFSASFCFMLAVGTPGNLVVKVAASIPMKKMLIAGAGPTITTLVISWVFMMYYAPVIWPELKKGDTLDWTGLKPSTQLLI